MSTALVVPSGTPSGFVVTQRHIILNHVLYIGPARTKFNDG